MAFMEMPKLEDLNLLLIDLNALRDYREEQEQLISRSFELLQIMRERCPDLPMGIISNQGGPAWAKLSGQAKYGHPESVKDVILETDQALQRIGIVATWMIATWPGFKAVKSHSEGQWPYEKCLDAAQFVEKCLELNLPDPRFMVMSRPSARKPQVVGVAALLYHTDLMPEGMEIVYYPDVLYIGPDAEDRELAVNVGMNYIWSHDWHTNGWHKDDMPVGALPHAEPEDIPF